MNPQNTTPPPAPPLGYVLTPDTATPGPAALYRWSEGEAWRPIKGGPAFAALPVATLRHRHGQEALQFADPKPEKTAFLHFGSGAGPFQTISVPVKEAPLWHHERGLQQTASGYGRRLATRYLVKWAGKWRRVYVACFSNAGTAYIGPAGKWLATVDLP